MTDTESPDETPRFGPLSDYRVPAMPTRDTLQIVLTRARELLRRRTDAPRIDDACLHSSTLDMLDAAAPRYTKSRSPAPIWNTTNPSSWCCQKRLWSTRYKLRAYPFDMRRSIPVHQ